MKRLFQIFMVLLISVQLKAQVSTADSLALVDFYNATNGPGWFMSTNWLTGPVASWQGITVVGTRVTQINLGGNTLTGALPATFTNLTKLEDLRISKNNITSLGVFDGMAELTDIAADRNLLTSLPPLEVIPQLEYFNVAENMLSEFPDLKGMENIRTLVVRDNIISEMPPLYDVLKLRTLDLAENELVWIPSLSNNKELELLDVSENMLTGLPVLEGLDSLVKLYVSKNQLEDLPGLNLPSLQVLDISFNKLEFDDLESAKAETPPLLTFLSGSQAEAGDSQTFLNTATIFDPVIMTVPEKGTLTEYEWFLDGTSITTPSAAGFVLTLGTIFGIPAVTGTYHCEMTNPSFPGDVIDYAPYELEDYPVPYITITNANDTLEATFPVSYVDNIIIEADQWVIQGNTDLTISNCTIWICNMDAGIEVLDFSSLTLNNVVLKPCDGSSTWMGIDIRDNADLDVDDAVIYNAAYGIDISSFNLTSVRTSTFINCNTGIRLFGPSPFGSTAVDIVHDNTFVLNSAVPDYTGVVGVDPQNYTGISIRDRNLGTFGFSAGVKGNLFLNETMIPCIDYCGIIAENSGLVIEGNKYIDMYCGVDIQNPSMATVIIGDSVINLNVAECTAISHKFEDATVPVKLTGSTMITTPSSYDSIFVAIAAINCTNWVEIDNNTLEYFDHNQVMEGDYKIRILDNQMTGGYVGIYFRNTRRVTYQCNVTDDIFCGSGYRVDNNNLLFVEANYPNWFATQNNFRWNAITPPPYNQENNVNDPDHDDEYSMRFFGCPAANPAVACGMDEGITVSIAAPDISANDMDSLRIEFTNDTPLNPFGSPSLSCEPGSPRYARRFEDPREWLAWAHSGPTGTGDFKDDVRLLKAALPVAADPDNQLVVWPNPGHGLFYLSAEEPGRVEIRNSTGILIKTQFVNQSVEEIDMGAASDGIYHIKLFPGNGQSGISAKWILHN